MIQWKKHAQSGTLTRYGLAQRIGCSKSFQGGLHVTHDMAVGSNPVHTDAARLRLAILAPFIQLPP